VVKTPASYARGPEFKSRADRKLFALFQALYKQKKTYDEKY